MIYAQYGRTLMIQPNADEDADALFERMCEEFENTKIEQDPDGNISIMAPAGFESSARSAEITTQLRQWAKQENNGVVCNAQAVVRLPDHSKRGPDAAWVSNRRVQDLSAGERKSFPKLVPEFVIELRCPSDRLKKLQEKMELWLRNGVELALLIDPDNRTIHVYRHGQQSGMKIDAFPKERMAGEGPIAGFLLHITPIWAGLDL